jgi:arsenite methyltransferase
MSAQTLNADALRQAVARQYGQVAIRPEGDFPFPVGRAFAEALGYDPKLLDTLPASAVDCFTGISNPLALADLQAGETVLDLGCGAGVDTLLMARQVGPAGRVIGVDLAPEMVDRARCNATAQGLSQVDIRLAPAEKLPLEDNTVDAVIVNGIFNLCANKEAVAAEIWRVLKPGGRLLVSEIVLQLPDEGVASFQACSLADTPSPEAALAKWFS